MSDICSRRRVSKTRGTDAKGRRLPASYKWSSQLPGWRERDVVAGALSLLHGG